MRPFVRPFILRLWATVMVVIVAVCMFHHRSVAENLDLIQANDSALEQVSELRRVVPACKTADCLRSITDDLRRIETDKIAPGVSLNQSQLFRSLTLEQQRRQEIRNSLFQKIHQESLTVTAALVVAFFATLSVWVIVKITFKQQSLLEDAIQTGQRAESAYQQVVENLPIGLFTFRNGIFQYTNQTWDDQLGCCSLTDRNRALELAVDGQDVPHVFRTLHLAEDACLPFRITYRQKSRQGMRHMETRGVPIVGQDGLEHILGFTIDVTETAEVMEHLEENFQGMVRALVRAVEAKDPYTAGHSERVMQYAVKIGQAMQLPQEQLHILEMGSLIHDVGKIGVPDAVLTKPGHLTADEMNLIREHSLCGSRMIEHIPAFKKCLPIVQLHHERMDGSGYPFGLQGDEIPVLVRIVSVSDAFDAMTSNRSYRSARPQALALEELRNSAELGRLDPKIVAILADIVERDGTLWVPDLVAA